MEPKCQYHIGCHNCPIEKLKEDMRMFRQAIVNFLVEPTGHLAEAKEQALSLKNQIDEWYEPHSSDYQPMHKED